MNKKITIIGCVLLLVLVTIPLVSAITQDTSIEKKESPLYRIRTHRAISEKIGEIMETIKTKFLGGRIFWVPFNSIYPELNPPDTIFTGLKMFNMCTNGCYPSSCTPTDCNVYSACCMSVLDMRCKEL